MSVSILLGLTEIHRSKIVFADYNSLLHDNRPYYDNFLIVFAAPLVERQQGHFMICCPTHII